VPAGVDGAERRDSLGVRPLDPAHEGPAGGALAEAGVDAGRVGVPDVDRGTLDRPAARGVDDAEPERQRRPRSTFGDVPAELLVRDVVRTLGLLGGQHARHGSGRHRGRASSVGGGGLPGAHADGASQKARETHERPAAGDELVHADEGNARACEAAVRLLFVDGEAGELLGTDSAQTRDAAAGTLSVMTTHAAKSAEKKSTPWGSASLLDEVRVAQRAGDK